MDTYPFPLTSHFLVVCWGPIDAVGINCFFISKFLTRCLFCISQFISQFSRQEKEVTWLRFSSTWMAHPIRNVWLNQESETMVKLEIMGEKDWESRSSLRKYGESSVALTNWENWIRGGMDRSLWKGKEVYQEDKVIVLYEFCSCISMPVWLKARAEGTLLFVFGDARQAMDRGEFSRADQRSKWPGRRSGRSTWSVPDCASQYLTVHLSAWLCIDCAFVCLTVHWLCISVPDCALTVHLCAWLCMTVLLVTWTENSGTKQQERKLRSKRQ